MKKLILVSRPAAGGLRGHMISLLRLLDRSRWDICVAAPQPLLDSLPFGLPAYHLFPVDISGRMSLSDPFAAGILASHVRRMRSDDDGSWPIVHAHGLRAGWIGALAHMGSPFPLLVTLHNLPPDRTRVKAALGMIAKHAVRIVCVSDAVAKLVPAPQKIVISNGIELSRFAMADRTAAREDLGLERNQFVVGAAARFSPEKGLDVLLQAASEMPETQFLIAGSGPQSGVLAAKAPSNVRFLGYLENVERLMIASDAFVIPSRSEGQSVVALEAMATGVPIVATRIGGLEDMITNEVNGLLVPPEDHGAIRQALVRLREHPDLRIQIGEAGKAYALQHADIQEMIKALDDLYEEITAPND